ncbi:histidine phosphatase family protein [Pararhizobium gei]|uniref:histidine phosphatase family protein n=1 Tax=Pararhizobium gei TaxID=1395951 RepID=UPI0023DAE942|nr:histidine phosphatase family protein [Rhizobium gei]
MAWQRIILALCFCALGTSPARAQDNDAWATFRLPGTHALMRHATAPGIGDPANFRLGDCATQRNLDQRGRDEAEAIGAAIRAHGVPVNRVLTSQWCRTRDTARLLGLGTAREEPALNSFFEDSSTRQKQTRDVVTLLSSLSPQDKAILVTHQVNITALVGGGVSSGEIILVSVTPNGTLAVEGRIQPGG